MTVTPAETLLVASILGAATALLGAWLSPQITARSEERRFRRQKRTEVYVNWLQFTENLATWAFQPGADFAQTFLPQLHNMKAELDLVASHSVSALVQEYIDELNPALAAVEQAVRGLPNDPHQLAYVAGVTFGRATEKSRNRVLNAMRNDLGFE